MNSNSKLSCRVVIEEFLQRLLKVLATKHLKLGLGIYAVASVSVLTFGLTSSCDGWVFQVRIDLTLHGRDPFHNFVILLQFNKSLQNSVPLGC